MSRKARQNIVVTTRNSRNTKTRASTNQHATHYMVLEARIYDALCCFPMKHLAPLLSEQLVRKKMGRWTYTDECDDLLSYLLFEKPQSAQSAHPASSANGNEGPQSKKTRLSRKPTPKPRTMLTSTQFKAALASVSEQDRSKLFPLLVKKDIAGAVRDVILACHSPGSMSGFTTWWLCCILENIHMGHNSPAFQSLWYAVSSSIARTHANLMALDGTNLASLMMMLYYDLPFTHMRKRQYAAELKNCQARRPAFVQLVDALQQQKDGRRVLVDFIELILFRRVRRDNDSDPIFSLQGVSHPAPLLCNNAVRMHAVLPVPIPVRGNFNMHISVRPRLRVGSWNMHMLTMGRTQRRGRYALSTSLRGQMPEETAKRLVLLIWDAISATNCDVCALQEINADSVQLFTRLMRKHSPGGWTVIPSSPLGQSLGGQECHVFVGREWLAAQGRCHVKPSKQFERCAVATFKPGRRLPTFTIHSFHLAAAKGKAAQLSTSRSGSSDASQLLDLANATSREADFEKLFDLAKQPGTILVGDFNYNIGELIERHYLARNDPGSDKIQCLTAHLPFTSIGGFSDATVGAMDHIVASTEFQSRGPGVVADLSTMRNEEHWGPDQNWLSDHLLVWAEFALEWIRE